jgi:undecaprenyl-diphosphatase
MEPEMGEITYEHDVRGWPLRALIGGAIVAVVSSLIASSGDVPGWEQGIFHAINDLPDWLRAPMWVFQLAGLLLLPLVVAAGALVFRRFRLAIALIALIPLKLFVEKAIVKQVVERDRPGTSICHLDLTCGHFRDVPVEGLSFVSGHAIIAWAVATLLWPYLPGRWRWLPVGVALANAVARVYLGAHNPLDVVGGAGIGVALGALLTMIVGSPVPQRSAAAVR